MKHCRVLDSLEGTKETGRDGLHRGILARAIVGKPGCFCNTQPTQPGIRKSCRLHLDWCTSSCEAKLGEEHGSGSTNRPLEGAGWPKLEQTGQQAPGAGPSLPADLDKVRGRRKSCILHVLHPACASPEQCRESCKPAYLPSLVGSQSMRL